MTDKVAELRNKPWNCPPKDANPDVGAAVSPVDEGAELEWEREIARRVDELKAGTVKTIPRAEVRSRALARIHGTRR